jgi:hypothetical protein
MHLTLANLCWLGLSYSQPEPPHTGPWSAGDAFFADLPPRDLRADKAAAQELQRRLHVLLGQGCRRDGGPWMELCLKSYYGDPTHPWQTRQYRVFGATLQLPPPDGAAADVS